MNDDLEALAIKSANRYYNLAVMRGKALTVLIDGNHISQDSLETLLAELYDLRFQNNIFKEKQKSLSAFRETEKNMKEGKACYMCGSTENLFFDGNGVACKECHTEKKESGKSSTEIAAVRGSREKKAGTKEEPKPTKNGKTDPKKLEEDIYNLIKFTKKATRKEIMESLKLKSSLISSLLFKMEKAGRIVAIKKDKCGTKEYSIALIIVPREKEKKIDHEKIAKAKEIDVDYNILREMFWDAYNKDKRIGKKMLMKAMRSKNKNDINDFLSKIYYDLEYRERIEANTGFHISVMIGQKGLEDCIMLTSMIDIPA